MVLNHLPHAPMFSNEGLRSRIDNWVLLDAYQVQDEWSVHLSTQGLDLCVIIHVLDLGRQLAIEIRKTWCQVCLEAFKNIYSSLAKLLLLLMSVHNSFLSSNERDRNGGAGRSGISSCSRDGFTSATQAKSSKFWRRPGATTVLWCDQTRSVIWQLRG